MHTFLKGLKYSLNLFPRNLYRWSSLLAWVSSAKCRNDRICIYQSLDTYFPNTGSPVVQEHRIFDVSSQYRYCHNQPALTSLFFLMKTLCGGVVHIADGSSLFRQPIRRWVDYQRMQILSPLGIFLQVKQGGKSWLAGVKVWLYRCKNAVFPPLNVELVH